jgi:hypothetical protein
MCCCIVSSIAIVPCRQNKVDETFGACGMRFRDTVLGPWSGQRPISATSAILGKPEAHGHVVSERLLDGHPKSRIFLPLTA